MLMKRIKTKQCATKQALLQQKSFVVLKNLSDQFADTSNAVNSVYLGSQNDGEKLSNAR